VGDEERKEERPAARSARQIIVEARAMERSEARQAGFKQDLRRVFEEQLKPLLPLGYPLPDRAGLSTILGYQSIQRRTAFNNLYGTNFNRRQTKVIRNQVICTPQYRRLRDIVTVPAAARLAQAPGQRLQDVKSRAKERSKRLLRLGVQVAPVPRQPLDAGGAQRLRPAVAAARPGAGRRRVQRLQRTAGQAHR
jgi:hypothetical protein